MKLEVGMYVRTKYNGIFNIQVLEAIRDIDCDYIEINYIRFPRNEILKASHNIIDLIETGDYVNGYMVEEVVKVPNEEIDRVVKLATDNVFGWEYEAEELYKDEIKSIVTKEQFSQMEYKVGD